MEDIMKKKWIFIMLCILSFLATHIMSKQRAEHENKIELQKQEEAQKQKESDHSPPILKLKESKLTITTGIEINYLSLVESAYDEEDGDLIEQVNYTKINTSVPGQYTITYTVSDHAGNQTSVELIVKVIEDYGIF